MKPDIDGIILLNIRIINLKIGKKRPTSIIHTAKDSETRIEYLNPEGVSGNLFIHCRFQLQLLLRQTTVPNCPNR
jgi:hypothetical protein